MHAVFARKLVWNKMAANAESAKVDHRDSAKPTPVRNELVSSKTVFALGRLEE